MSAPHGTEQVAKAKRLVVSVVIVALVAVGSTVAVRAAYGAFADDVLVETRLATAGQALRPGSDVKYRGVNVGKVRSLTLRDRGVDVVLQLGKGERIPADTEASVRSKTLFGEKYVELAVRPDAGSYLGDGDTVVASGTGTEVEELLDTTDGLLRGIDATELAVLVDELVQASQGEGQRVANLIDRGVDATAVLAATLDAQLRAVDSLERFAVQYRDIGPLINDINVNLNELLPTFNAARADYERLLRTLRPLAEHLSELISVNEADIGRLLDDGDNIVRVLTARKENISETIAGLDVYTRTLADAIAPGTLPDGSRYGHLKIFVDLGDLSALLCAVLSATSPTVDLSVVRESLALLVPQLACPADGDGEAGDGEAGDGAPLIPDLPDLPELPGLPGLPGLPATDGEGGPGPADPITDLVSALATPDVATNDGTVGDLLAALLRGAP